MMDYHELIDALTCEDKNALDYIYDAVEMLEHLYSELKAANARCETLSKMVTQYQDDIIPGYRERAEKAERERRAVLERLGYVPNSDLEGLRLAYNDELQERLILKRDHKNLYEKYLKALEARPPLPGYTIRPYVAEARARKLEDALLLEFAPDEYFKTGLRESLMRAIDEHITYSKQEMRDAVIWQARLNVAVKEG